MQVPDHFSFVVKAPALVCDAVMRDEEGGARCPTRTSSMPPSPRASSSCPASKGLGAKAGPLVFQVSPLPRGLVEEAATLIERLAAFFAALPQELGKHRPLYAPGAAQCRAADAAPDEDAGGAGVRYCVGLHDRMPEVERQEAALEALWTATRRAPLVVRWNLHRGFLYQAAKQRYEPFDRLVDEDPETRRILARMAADAFKARRKVWITANNKAEGSAPLSLLKLAEEIARTAGLNHLILLALAIRGAKPLEPRPLRTRVCGRRGDIPPLAPVSSKLMSEEDDARGGPTGKGDTAWLCRHSRCVSCWKRVSISVTTPGVGTPR